MFDEAVFKLDGKQLEQLIRDKASLEGYEVQSIDWHYYESAQQIVADVLVKKRPPSYSPFDK